MGFLIRFLFGVAAATFLSYTLQAQSFKISSTPTVCTNPIFVQAADVNGDGRADILVLSGTTNQLTVLTNNGQGGFISSATLQIGVTGLYANAFTAADVNGDGKVDLVCAVSSGYPSYISRLYVLTNDGSGGFPVGSYYPCGTNPAAVVVADVNGDGKPDLISANVGPNLTYHNISVDTNNGSGIFVSNTTVNVGQQPDGLVAADVNGDGKIDIITANFGDSTLTVLTNNGNGGFKLSSSPPVGGAPMCVVAADVNHDGKVDLISVNSGDGTLSVLTNDGTGKFVTASTPFVGLTPYSVTAADVNGDGWVDLICNNAYTNALTIMTNDGAGNFVLMTTVTVGSGPYSLTAADVNGDGRLDLISANSQTNTISILTNTMTFLPRLSFQRSSNGMVVDWPAQWSGWAGWTLQQGTNFLSANWTGFVGTVGNDGTTASATNLYANGNHFFRLMHP
jgi:hypothetical protein